MDNNYDGPLFKKGENNNEVSNFFSQYQFKTPLNQESNSSFSSNPSDMDIPPELDEIKNLSDAKELSGPTLSALDPMNVMPENNDEPKKEESKLDLYDKGLNKFNSEEPQDEEENKEENEGQEEQEENNNYEPEPYNYDNILKNGINKDSNSYDISSNNKEESTANSKNDITFNSDVTSPLKENNMFNPNNSFNVDINNLPDLENNDDYNKINLRKEETAINSNKIHSLEDYLKTKEEKEDDSNDSSDEEATSDDQEDDDEEKQENDYNLGLASIPDLNSFIIKNKDEPKKEDEYGIVQDVDLSVDQPNKIEEIEDISNILDEQDSLEIIDNDSNEEETIDSDNNKETLEKIKSLITELKNNGAQIETEEFDFEDMYQLIVKIKKEGEENENRDSK